MKVVSVSGPPSAGKTTLCTQLAGVLRADALFVPDIPRAALERLDPALESWNDPEFQHYVGYAQLLAERREGRELLRVCDKSLIDALAYWDVLFDGPPPNWARGISSTHYDLVLLCDHTEVVPDQGSLGSVHYDLREPLAHRIDELARDAAHRVVMLSGSRSQRLARAVSEIDNIRNAVGLATGGGIDKRAR